MGKGISRNTKILALASFLVDVSSEMIFPLLPFFLTVILGAPVFAIGLMESLGESVVALTAVLSGFYSDKIGRRKKIIIFGYGLSAAFKGFLVLVASWPQVIALRVMERIGKGVRDTPRDALIGLSETKETLGKAFGFRKFLDNLGAVLGPLIAAFLIAVLFEGQNTEPAYRLVFLIAVIPAALAVAALFFVRDKPSGAETPKIAFKNILSNVGVRNFMLVMAFLYLGNFSTMFFLLRAYDYMALVLIPIAYLTYNVSYTLFSLPSGVMADRFGARKTILFAMLLLLSALAGFAFYPSILVLFFMFVALGWFMAIAETVPQVFIVKRTEKSNYASAIGSYRGLTGIAAFPANLIAGLLWAVPVFSVPGTFIFSMATTVLAIVFLLVFVRD
jgi:MFS family permease